MDVLLGHADLLELVLCDTAKVESPLSGDTVGHDGPVDVSKVIGHLITDLIAGL